MRSVPLPDTVQELSLASWKGQFYILAAVKTAEDTEVYAEHDYPDGTPRMWTFANGKYVLYDTEGSVVNELASYRSRFNHYQPQMYSNPKYGLLRYEYNPNGGSGNEIRQRGEAVFWAYDVFTGNRVPEADASTWVSRIEGNERETKNERVFTSDGHVCFTMPAAKQMLPILLGPTHAASVQYKKSKRNQLFIYTRGGGVKIFALNHSILGVCIAEDGLTVAAHGRKNVTIFDLD